MVRSDGTHTQSTLASNITHAQETGSLIVSVKEVVSPIPAGIH